MSLYPLELCSLVKVLLSVHTRVFFAIFRALIALILLVTPSLALAAPRSPGGHYIRPFVGAGASVGPG